MCLQSRVRDAPRSIPWDRGYRALKKSPWVVTEKIHGATKWKPPAAQGAWLSYKVETRADIFG
jgi:hypothetical protein